jgi:[acyl-carrier-protein] S-malonyltransferase
LLILCPGGSHAALVADTLALWQALRGGMPAPALVAGYGDGDLTAHAVAGAITTPDAVRLASLRSTLRHDCLHAHPGQAVLAVTGLRLADAGVLLAGDLFYIGSALGEYSCVAGGPAAGLAAARNKVSAAGGHSRRLPGAMACNTPYLAAAVPPFAAALRGTDFLPGATAVLSGLDASRITGKASAVEHLSRQLAEKIMWLDCMDACAALGAGVALELATGPDAMLARLLRARHPAIRCRAVADFRSVDGVFRWLRQH